MKLLLYLPFKLLQKLLLFLNFYSMIVLHINKLVDLLI